MSEQVPFGDVRERRWVPILDMFTGQPVNGLTFAPGTLGHTQCPKCRAKKGDLHRPGCQWDMCPDCKIYRQECGCKPPPKETPMSVKDDPRVNPTPNEHRPKESVIQQPNGALCVFDRLQDPNVDKNGHSRRFLLVNAKEDTVREYFMQKVLKENTYRLIHAMRRVDVIIDSARNTDDEDLVLDGGITWEMALKIVRKETATEEGETLLADQIEDMCSLSDEEFAEKVAEMQAQQVRAEAGGSPVAELAVDPDVVIDAEAETVEPDNGVEANA